MKKFMFFALLLFAVFAFAAPPPDLVLSDIVTEQSAFVVQDIQTVAEYTFVSNEVAFVDIGNLEFETCFTGYAEQVKDVVLPQALVIDVSSLQLNELKKPPAFSCNDSVAPIKLNMQNSNYGYPLTGDNCNRIWLTT